MDSDANVPFMDNKTDIVARFKITIKIIFENPTLIKEEAENQRVTPKKLMPS